MQSYETRILDILSIADDLNQKKLVEVTLEKIPDFNEAFTWTEALQAAAGKLPDYRVAKNSGALIMKCLMHDERTPSMHCWPSGNFLCHGCGASGNKVEFISNFPTLPTLWRLSSPSSPHPTSLSMI